MGTDSGINSFLSSGNRNLLLRVGAAAAASRHTGKVTVTGTSGSGFPSTWAPGCCLNERILINVGFLLG